MYLMVMHIPTLPPPHYRASQHLKIYFHQIMAFGVEKKKVFHLFRGAQNTSTCFKRTRTQILQSHTHTLLVVGTYINTKSHKCSDVVVVHIVVGIYAFCRH